MNRSLRKNMRKGCSYRKNGGGYAVGAPLIPQPASDWDFAVKAPLHTGYSDCTFAQRPGQLMNEPHPELAQASMAGGRSRKARKQRGGVCPCMAGLGGGGRKSRKQRGGSYGYGINPAVSVGGEGPNVGALVAPVPCDARAGAGAEPMGLPDPRAPADLYSLTPNQSGGAATLGNAFDDSCYRATGSSLPIYNASSAGFHFNPSTDAGATLPDGVTAYMEVVPHAARTGGSRRHRKHRKSTRRHHRLHRRQ